MRLVYAKLHPGNFGDELNPYLWPRLFPKAFLSDEGIDFVGIGTILSQSIDSIGRQKVVFGPGAGYWKPPKFDASWQVYFVRGPLTAKLINLPSKYAITDAAYCLSFVDETPANPPHGVLFMPHHKSEAEVDWRSLCADLGWKYVSPSANVDDTLALLKSAKLVVSEAMHGAIVADLFRVPWVPVRYGFRSLDFKWRDWCSSLHLDYRPVDLPPLLDIQPGKTDTIERFIKKTAGVLRVGKPAWRATPVIRSGSKMRDQALKLLRSISDKNQGFLSEDSALERAKSRLWEKIEQFRLDWEQVNAKVSKNA